MTDFGERDAHGTAEQPPVAQRPVAELSGDEKRSLLVRLLKREATRSADQLSVAQRRYWVLRQMEPTAPTHVLSAVAVTGPLDLGLLRQALSAVVPRHAELTAGFVEVEGQPIRVTAPSAWLPIPVVDLSDTPTDRQESEIARVAADDAARPFDTASPPLLRITAVRRSARSHVLILVAHQMVADAAALRLVASQVAAAYSALAGDGPATGEPVRPISEPAPFADFATWQRTWLESPEGQAALDWWRRRLDDVPVLDLPTDRPRPTVKVKGLRGARRAASLPPDVTAGLADLVDRLGHDEPLVVLAAWFALLARYSGQRDFAVGVLDEERPGREWDGVVGPFEQTLVVRANLTGDPTFGDLLARVASAWRDAREHRLVPFERLVGEVPQRQDVTHSPLFQVRFGVTGDDARAAGGWQPVDVDPRLAAFDLTLRLRPTPGAGPQLVLEYSTELYDDDTAGRVLGELTTILRGACRAPSTQLSALPLLTDEEADLLASWRGNPWPVQPPAGTLHQLIEEQVTRTPDATALRGGGSEVSYRELNARANRIAHRLRRLGVGPQTLVAVAAERHPDAVVAQLAVLKAGGGYVPLDPEYPAERIRYICTDARVPVVLSSHRRARYLPHDAWTVLVTDAAKDYADEPDTNPEPLAGPGDLAYAIYTSGSTGAPKGVLVEHAAIVNSTLAREGVFPEATGSYVMLAPLSFDASGAGVYWTLSRGGRLVLPSDDEVHDPRRLAELLRRVDATCLDGVPSQYGLLLETEPDSVARLRCVILAGEALPPALAQRHRRVAPDTRLFNEYGPTEGTVWSTVHPVGPEDTTVIPIGRPVRGARVHVVDENLTPAPIGVPGELCLAGRQLARGYVNRPDLTAERFVPEPGVHGARMYRTGDLGRWRPDGTLEFLGRADTQVKVRGFRVELAEIETALQAYPAVAASAVIIRVPGGAETAQLVAYAAPRSGQTLVRTDLERFLADRLPAYMLPSHYVVLDALPMTDRGKVDRAALPDTTPGAARGTAYEAPRTKIEREVAQAFAEALGVERVGRHDDFFAFGGNSLLIARVGARLSKAYGVDLPLHSLFTTPTVAGVSTTIEIYRKEGYQGLLAKRDPQLLVKEAQLDPAITPAGLPMADVAQPAGILLTGATGYLGIFLLEQLLKQTAARVWCLVRAADEDEARQRLRRTAASFRVDWTDEFEARVQPLVGDLGQPLFGLTEERFDELAGAVDVIYHNGALVNFVYPYSVLKAPNVGGTVEVLRLACRRKAKLVHHVSTIDVLVGAYIPRPFLEVDLPELPPRVPFSYPQSKWIAEKMVVAARERGLPVTIFRPSIMMGHTRTGACHETDYILTGLRGFLDLGILPQYEEILNAVTVDFASEAIVRLARRPDAPGRIFHIWNTDALPTVDVYPWIRSFGFDFEVVPFQEALDRAMNVDPSHPIYPLLPVLFLYLGGDAGLPMEFEVHKAIDPDSECRNTRTGLAGSGLAMTKIDEAFIHSCLEYLVESGYLKRPRALVGQS